VNRTTTPSTLLWTLAAFGFILAGCTTGSVGKADTPTSTSASSTTTSTSTSTTTTTEPEPEEIFRHPLSGVIISSPDEIAQRPALAVKIDNHPRARPQAGLNEADIVFEENVENLTRFAVVFHSFDADPVGPIRSGRSQDVGILTPIGQPLFAWSGGNAGVRSQIRNSSLIDLDAGFSSGYYRRTGRGGAPHNLYSSTEALWANTPESFTMPRQIFPFLAPDRELQGQPANEVVVAMDGVQVTWRFDPESGRYLRFQNNAPHETEQSGQVSADNVVVMGVSYTRSSADPKSPEAQTTGFGPVYVFSGGVVREGIWSRETIEDPFVLSIEYLEEPFEEDDERLIGLLPGRTWVQLARNGDGFAIWS
jgi:hypothetical protein